MKPIIGISVDCKQDPEDARTGGNLMLNWNYAHAVTEAGGVPILIPPTADMEVVAGIVDGWLIPGGDDIDPSLWGEDKHAEANLIDPARFDAEKRLYQTIPPEMPVLGICYGCQFINVMRGGNLIQHLPDLAGRSVHTGGEMQTYRIDQDSNIGAIVGDNEIDGKSYHHQAINRLGSKLEITAHSEDGTVEAIEANDRPWLIGVQWHPERTQQDPKTRRIFEDFVRAAAEYQKTKRGVTAAR